MDELIGHIIAGGIIAILRLRRAEDLLPVAEALLGGGVNAIEFAPTAPGSLQALGPPELGWGPASSWASERS